MSLAMKHKKRVLSGQTAQASSAGVTSATETKTSVSVAASSIHQGNAFEGLKESLQADLTTLKHANGAEERNPFKASLVEKYRDFAEHLMASENWKDLTVLFHWLLWRLDLEGFEAVQELLRQGVTRGLTTPVGFQRDFVTVYLDEVRNYIDQAIKSGSKCQAEIITEAVNALNVGEMVTNAPLKAKLYALHGKVLHKAEQFDEAVKYYDQALTLDDGVGVKKLRALADKKGAFNG